jgi:hypothetical protein
MYEQLGFYQGATFGDVGRQSVRSTFHSFAADHSLWAVSLQHPCSSSGGRTWQTDVIVQSFSDHLLVSLRVTYFLTRGFIGYAPPDPDPSVPSLLRVLYGSPLWSVEDGGTPLSLEPKTLQVGDIPALKDLLFSADRHAPVLVIMPDYSGHQPLDPGRLALLLAGAVHIYVVPNQGDIQPLLSENKYLLPNALQFVWGAVRIYLPGIKSGPGVNWDHERRRHRYFNNREMVNKSALDVLKVFAQGVAARPVLPGELVGFESVVAMIHHTQLENLTTKIKATVAGNAEMSQWVAMFEEETVALSVAKEEL